ncbi:tail tube protein [Anaerobacterium chartisolvens]|uniref:Tail tube protein n=1 Tax=Anaerobacterium chartisolvens TaxID=1297424 RepID=A0A369AV53_9FIRM|nr:phage tail tube protein [Anaerobacterium chartisolvens]RCX13262.1 tail tube protein [Anaerobacterium chartisolvens]
MAIETKRVINGTYGQVWLNDSEIMEAYALQAKVEKKKEEISICGRPGTESKMVGFNGKGTLKIRKISSRMGTLLADGIRRGHDIRFYIMSSLADPDSYGAEKVLLKNVSFDDLTLMDWEAAKAGAVDIPFTFSDFEYLDEITA